MATGVWEPILAGELAARAVEAVRAVAAALPEAPIPVDPDAAAGASAPTVWNATLASGAAGQALFYAYLAASGLGSPGPEDPADFALERLDAATEAVAAASMGPSLFAGFPGIAWTEEHLAGRLFEAAADDERGEVDRVVLRASEAPRARSRYDLVHGLVGLGVYALEGLPRPSAVRCLERVVERLAESAERGPEGAAWFSPPAELPAYQKEMFPEGLYNLGASHGIAGTIAFLGATVAAGVATPLAGPLLEDAVRWLLARREPPARGFAFPHYHHPAVPAVPPRLAWCYGDLGIAAALLVAARGAGEPAWERTAVEIAGAAARPLEEGRVLDAGLCHGSAGIAHLFLRMARATGDERLAAAARSWYAWTLAFRRPQEGVAGFSAWASDSTWRADPGFLTGASGIGLALLGAVANVEPEWDRVLLLSARPAGGLSPAPADGALPQDTSIATAKGAS